MTKHNTHIQNAYNEIDRFNAFLEDDVKNTRIDWGDPESILKHKLYLVEQRKYLQELE